MLSDPSDDSICLLNIVKDATVYTKVRVNPRRNCIAFASRTQSSIPHEPAFVVDW